MSSKDAEALKAIGEYIEKKKPATLAEALHMLALIGIIASETMAEKALAAAPVMGKLEPGMIVTGIVPGEEWKIIA